MRVLIGVSADLLQRGRPESRSSDDAILRLQEAYLGSLLDNGAIAVALAVVENRASIRTLVDRLDGVLLSGGAFDVPPDLYGQEPRPWMGEIRPERSRFEVALLREAAGRDLPVLGICGGMQIINVALGGTLYQDIPQERPGSDQHRQPGRNDRPCHPVEVQAKTRLAAIVSGKRSGRPVQLQVNSTHHQAVRDLGRGLLANAFAPDGLIEGIESTRHRFLLGVQWHPERLYRTIPEQARIFRAFVRAATGGRPTVGGGPGK
jgi:putative glutamine amidotransferase